jgi:hypothetical protein
VVPIRRFDFGTGLPSKEDLNERAIIRVVAGCMRRASEDRARPHRLRTDRVRSPLNERFDLLDVLTGQLAREVRHAIGGLGPVEHGVLELRNDLRKQGTGLARETPELLSLLSTARV